MVAFELVDSGKEEEAAVAAATVMPERVIRHPKSYSGVPNEGGVIS